MIAARQHKNLDLDVPISLLPRNRWEDYTMGKGKRKGNASPKKVKKPPFKEAGFLDLLIFFWACQKGHPLAGLTMQRPKVPLRRDFSPASKAGLVPCLAFLPSPDVIKTGAWHPCTNPGSSCGDVGKTKALAHTSGACCCNYYMRKFKPVSRVIEWQMGFLFHPFCLAHAPGGRCGRSNGCTAHWQIPRRRILSAPGMRPGPGKE